MKERERILTGDRPTGPLHLGHYVGSLENRVSLQEKYDCYFIVADYQVLTDHLDKTEETEKYIEEVVLDWLSVGMDPQKSTFFIQSRIPEIFELTAYFAMLVNLGRLERNPTVKDEVRAARISKMSLGFLGYPVSQAADILVVRANLVPVGEDQVPHVEHCREIARRFNEVFGKVFPVPKALVGRVPRLPGLDGQKMSKSRGNAIYLSDSPEAIERKINRGITDPERIHPTDVGHPEVCNIFAYHKAFNQEGQEGICESCKKGQIGCVECKKEIATKINSFLDPVRQRRAQFLQRPGAIREALISGTEKAKGEAEETLRLVKQAMYFEYGNIFGRG